MSVVLTVARRALFVPTLLPLTLVALAGAWAGPWLAMNSMGATDAYLSEVRHGCLLFVGTLVLSMSEPLLVGREAASGLLSLRVAKAGGLGLVPRWLGLTLACVPLVVLSAFVAGGAPRDPAALLAQLLVLAAGGLLLGSFLERGRLVPALWALLVIGHLRPWLEAVQWEGLAVGKALALIVPRLGAVDGSQGALHALLWSLAALALARARLLAVAGR